MDELPAVVARVAPIVMLDEREPFPPLRAGWSLLTEPGASPSFQREIEFALPVAAAIEYAIWFEWDISHLNELEHIWVYVDEREQVVGCEGSWHGFYRALTPGEGLVLEDGRPRVYAKPGKHAFAADPADFEASRVECERDCGPLAGRGGLQLTHLTLGTLEKTAEADARIRAYLQTQRFVPAWRFTRRFAFAPAALTSWNELAQEIPLRLRWRLERLRAGDG